MKRLVTAIVDPQTYRNIAYLLLGLPLGTIWFTVLVTGLAVGVSVTAIALLGIPVLLGTWYASRWFADIERRLAGVLLRRPIATAPAAPVATGNLWRRLRRLSGDATRRREAGFLMLRFPVGIATFTIAVVVLTAPAAVAYAPFAAHFGHDSFGTWQHGERLHDAVAGGWGWSLVPAAAALFVGGVHLLNWAAESCGRWATGWLDTSRR